MPFDREEPGLPPELAALALEAAAAAAETGAVPGESRTGAPAAAEDAKPVQTIAQEWAGAVEMGAAFLTASMPELKAVYTDEKVAELGAALGAVAQKYGWRWSSWLDSYREEFALAMVAFPLAAATLKAVKARNAKKTVAPGGSVDQANDLGDLAATVERRPAAPAATDSELIKANA